MEAAKGKIEFESTSGEKLELGFIIPFEIIQDVVCFIIDWKERVYIKPKEYDEFLEKSKQITNGK